MNKVKKTLIFFFVLIFMGLGIAIYSILIEPQSVFADTTPIYQLPFTYSHQRSQSSGVETGTANSLNCFLGSGNSVLTVELYGSAYNSSIQQMSTSSTPAFSLSDVNIRINVTGGGLVYSGYYLTVSNVNTGTKLLDNAYKATSYNAGYLDEGLYEILFTYNAQQIRLTVTANFYIDRAAPTVTLSTASGFSNSSVTVNYSDTSGIASATYTKTNNGSYPSSASTFFSDGTSFTEEGNYTVKVKDNGGNVTTKYFTIDKTAPTLSLSGVSNGGFTSGNVSASWSTTVGGVGGKRMNDNDVLTVRYSRSTSSSFPSSADNGYSDGTSLSDEGNYRITISDSAGNSTSYTFTIDKSAPTLSLSGVSNGGFTSGNVSASWSTTVGGVGTQRTNDSDSLTVKYSSSTSSSFPSSATTYYSGNSLSAEGNYRITISDSAGNSTSYTFTIDKSAPTLSLSGVSNGGFTSGNVSASWSTTVGGVGAQRTNSSDSLTVRYSRSTSSSFPSSADNTYSSGTSLSNEGNYRITISDSAGNSTSYTFTIDKSAPTFELSGVSNGGFTNDGAIVTWSTTVGGVGAQRTNSSDSLTVRYSRSTSSSFPSSATITYTAGLKLTTEGNYRIEIKDAAGNTSFFVFTIDRTAPTFTLRTSDSSSFINGRTAKDVTVTWSTTVGGNGTQRMNDNDVLTVKYSRSTSSSFPTSADSICTREEQMTTEGKYLIEISDAAGNTYSEHFEIYRQPPTFTILSESGELLSQEPLAYNKNIKITFHAECTATLNSRSYTSGTVISEEAEYSFVLTDELGNKATATIYIIKTPPTANLKRLQSPVNRWYETAGKDGKTYSFASYDNAHTVADERERATIIGGVWTKTEWDGGVDIAPEDVPIAAQGMAYYIYKSYDSASKLNAYFSIASLNKAVEKHLSINIRYIPATPTVAADGEIVYRDIYFSNDAITFNRISNCTLYIDGIARPYPYTLTEFGQHTVFEIDIAGNSVSYSVIIDEAKPIVRVTNLNGNMPEVLTYGTSNYFTYGIRIYLDDADDQAILQIDNEYYLGGVVELRSAGVYSIRTRDAAGNSGNLTIYISLIEPTITITENEVADVVNSFSITISKNYTLNNIKSLSILRYNADEGDWETLSSDNSSPSVSIEQSRLSYLFNVSGQYRIIVVDAFGRFLERYYTFVQGSPKGIISTTGGTVLNSGDSTKSNFYFTWSNLLDCSAEISVNGGSPVPYEKGTIITAEGSYSIRLYSNINDVSNVYEITIDKTAPVGVLTANGVELPNGSTTRHAVSLTWEESGCTATLNGEPYANGSKVAEDGDYTIELSDRAGNKRTYTFRIKTTPPKIILTTSIGRIENYDVTKYDVYVSWTERNCTCLVNGANYVQNTKINVENSYTVILTDAYGNSSSYFFTIDKTPPTGQLFVDGQEVTTSTMIYTNKKVSFTWSELGCSAVINNDFIYNSGSIISEDGSYVIKLTDKAGNVATYSFVIKTSKPTAKLLTNGTEVGSGARTKYEARLTWTESGCTATVNGEPYSKGALITAEGDYTFVLFDSYGNSNSWQITIDKTPPVVTITSNGEYVNNGEVSRFDVCYFWDDIKATATLNGVPVEMGGVAEEEGEYTLIVIDDVGNKTTVVFIIDKTAKVGTLIANSAILQNGSITRYSVYYTWNGSSYTVTLNGEPYEKGTLITAEGDYRIELTDKAGNVSVVTFTIDKTAPTGVLYEVKEDTAYEKEIAFATNGDVYFEWEEEGCTATLNGEPYEKGTLITAEGDYRIELTDKAGNVATFTFKIDKTAPRARAYTAANEIIEDNSITRHSIYFDWTESGCTATVNGEPYSKGALITETGTYAFVLSDAVGNVICITIEVYKIMPTAEIIPENDFVMPYLNDGFSIIWGEEGCTAMLNGEPYEKGTLITAEGYYMFILRNKVGVESIEYITIDRTPPVASIHDADGNVISADVALSYVYFDWTESGCTATLNGEPYRAKTTIIKDGVYNLLLTDAAGNVSNYSIRVARTKPTAILMKEDGTQLTNGGITSSKVSVHLTEITIATIEVDGNAYVEGDFISEIGAHVVVLTDEYGNTTEYNFTIKEPTEAQMTSNPFANIAKGSPVGTYILLAVLIVLAVVCIVVPLVRSKMKNSFKNKLK